MKQKTELNLTISIKKEIDIVDVEKEKAEAISSFSLALQSLCDKYQIDLYPMIEFEATALKTQ